jgi:S-adenosylmethionine/arginine decarboxylase-like enzyme
MKEEHHWGWHLLINASGCNKAINDVDKVRAFLRELVGKLDMHPIGAPMIVYVDTEEGEGVSGVQLITTSTLTFHGDVNGMRAFIDVFSCKAYSVTTVLELIDSWFQPEKCTHRFIYRDA